MRTIKFRVWDEKLYIMLTDDKSIPNWWKITDTHNGVLKYPNGILMQFTGLKDKNGVDIYEGDILKYYIRIGKVIFDKGQFEIHSEYDNHKVSLFSMYKEETEIIGNIHENEELIKKNHENKTIS